MYPRHLGAPQRHGILFSSSSKLNISFPTSNETTKGKEREGKGREGNEG